MLQVGILFSHLGCLPLGLCPRLVANCKNAPAEQEDQQNGNDNVSKRSQGRSTIMGPLNFAPTLHIILPFLNLVSLNCHIRYVNLYDYTK
jgi:hypothetical protein